MNHGSPRLMLAPVKMQDAPETCARDVQRCRVHAMCMRYVHTACARTEGVNIDGINTDGGPRHVPGTEGVNNGLSRGSRADARAHGICVRCACTRIGHAHRENTDWANASASRAGRCLAQDSQLPERERGD